ncbi:Glu-tRNA(Gln) amidotransferase GatDE subunit E [Candidatus Bathyarchaeota archaeon]|nr:MAG: Glu-tRNA(Gln) amidotransferase GatDE subunit E [Candidatus Bathyarchaeota archaeon]
MPGGRLDYAKLGLRVGLEIHRQLDTAEKLFCSCPTVLRKDEPHLTVLRRLRPTQSEVGEIDRAALFEFEKGKTIIYEAYLDTNCLVELDEEPPHEINREALDIALTIALMLNSKPVDEVHVMRKIVIDGSTPFGFQRTCVVALGGSIEVGGKVIPIQHVGLEEDAARKVGEEADVVRYRLDRLGIPLVEVATAPVITDPEEAREVALAIGRIMRATGRVKRGIGSIRQDLNISIEGGAITEVKGVQELDLIPKVVENEVLRQVRLLEIRDELSSRGLRPGDLKAEFVDATQVFAKTASRILRKAIRGGGVVLALRLPKFSGLLSKEIMPGHSFGKELADIASAISGLGGIFHTDEMPAYGVSEEEVRALRELAGAGPDDCVVFVAGEKEKCLKALRAVLDRAIEALEGVPRETRMALPDGRTKFMRPRPGAARMYPETDIPPVGITPEYVDEIRRRLPELPEAVAKRLISDYGLSEKLAWQVVDSDYLALFEEAVRETGVPATVVATVLTETLKSLRREGFDVGKLGEGQLLELFRLVGRGETFKESIPEVLKWLCQHEGASAREAVEALGLKAMSEEELREVVEEVLSKEDELIREKGMRALGPLMGAVMRLVRGRADPARVRALIEEGLRARLEGGQKT